MRAAAGILPRARRQRARRSPAAHRSTRSALLIVATAEACSNLARYDGIRYGLRAGGGDGLLDLYRKTRAAGFGPEVKRRIMLGTYALSLGLLRRLLLEGAEVRTLIRRDFERAFGEADVIVTPTAPTTAFRIGEKTADPLADVPLRRLHDLGQPGRPARRSAAVRLRRGGPADRPADRRPALRRGGRAARGARLRGRDRLACAPRRPSARHGRRRAECDSATTKRHRARGPRPAAHRDEDLLRLLGVVRRAAEPAHLPGLPRHARHAAGPEPPRRRVRGAPGLATGCRIAPLSRWARKNYFYPDL